MLKRHASNQISLSVRDPDVSPAFYTRLSGVRGGLDLSGFGSES